MSPAADKQTGGFVFTAPFPARLPGADIRRWVKRWRRELKLPPGVIAVVTVDSRTMQRLNRTWRGRNRPTNVLSFPYRPGHNRLLRPETVIAEILLCPPVVRREAAAAGISYRAHFYRLLRHGLIHLTGREHQTPATQRRWEQVERKLTSGPT